MYNVSHKGFNNLLIGYSRIEIKNDGRTIKQIIL